MTRIVFCPARALACLRRGGRELGVVDVGGDAVDAVDLGADRLRRRALALGQHDSERLPLGALEVGERLVDLLRPRAGHEEAAVRQVLGLAARKRGGRDEHEKPRHQHEAAMAAQEVVQTDHQRNERI